MKNFKLGVVVALFAVTLAVPALTAPKVQADEFDESSALYCRYIDGEFPSITNQGCDLALTKEVSVNGAAFVDADTSSEAVQAHVGDAVQWKITVKDNSEDGNTPFGIVTVHDVLPAGVTAGASTVSDGTYADGDWTFTLGQSLPATLVINSTATTAGLVKNTAALTTYRSDRCDGDCESIEYTDSDNDNNSNDAYVNIVADPVVVPPAVVATPAAPTLVNTGVNPLAVMLTAFTIATAAVIVFNFEKVKAELAKFRG